MQFALVEAKTTTLEAQLKADATKASFVQATQGRGQSPDVTLIAPAASTGSDRRGTLELAMIVGLVAGVVVAIGAVLVRANWPYLRDLRAEARGEA